MFNLTRPVRNLKRLRDVQVILFRYGFDMLIDQQDIKIVRKILWDKLHIRVGDMDQKSLPERVRLMLEELGPTYIKLGQVLSSRNDIFDQEWTRELSRLHDTVQPFPFTQVKEVVQSQFGKPLGEIFTFFDPSPFAAASLGQVHRAELIDHLPVMVKIQRPGIEKQIRSDIDILFQIAKQIESRTSWGKRYAMTSIIEEFAITLNQELDYRNEAVNADRLRRNMAHLSHVHIPQIFWDYVTERVLTMEYIQGIKINDLQLLDAAGIDRSQVADTFIRSIFQQILVDGFYHADPHPGNLLVDSTTGKLNYIDLGMMGSLILEERLVLSELIKAILERDSKEVTRLLLSIGKTSQPINEVRMRRSIEHLIHRYLEATLEQISFSKMLSEILLTIYQNGIQLPSEFVLALKALIQGEDVALKLDPQLSIIEIGKTISFQIIRQRFEPRVISGSIWATLLEFLRLSRSIPRALDVLLQQIDDGALKIGLNIPDFSRTINHAYIISNRLTAGVLVTGMIVGSSIAMNVSPNDSFFLIPILGIIGFILSMLVGILLVASVFLDLWQSWRRKK